MSWPSAVDRNFAQLDIKMDFQGNLILLVVTTPLSEDKIDGHTFKFTEKSSCGSSQRQSVKSVMDTLRAGIKERSNESSPPKASLLLVTLTAVRKHYVQDAPLLWHEEGIPPSNSLCAVGAEIVILKTGMYLAHGRGISSDRLALFLGDDEIARSQPNGDMEHFACIFTLKQVGILRVKPTWSKARIRSFELKLEELERSMKHVWLM
ncbi:unnamed protein product [Aphanomyces euteiches]